MGGRDREVFLTDPKGWRVLMEFLSDCLVLLVGAVGADGGLAIASFHMPESFVNSQGPIRSGPIVAVAGDGVVLDGGTFNGPPVVGTGWDEALVDEDGTEDDGPCGGARGAVTPNNKVPEGVVDGGVEVPDGAVDSDGAPDEVVNSLDEGGAGGAGGRVTVEAVDRAGDEADDKPGVGEGAEDEAGATNNVPVVLCVGPVVLVGPFVVLRSVVVVDEEETTGDGTGAWVAVNAGDWDGSRTKDWARAKPPFVEGETAGNGPITVDEEGAVAVVDVVLVARRCRKFWCVWTGSCRKLKTVPIIKLPMSVNTPHQEGRIRLEELSGELLLMKLQGVKVEL
jgi:hypothetical protein